MLRDDIDNQIGVLNKLVTIVKHQIHSYRDFMVVAGDSQLDCVLELKKSTSDLVITMNSLLTTSLSSIWAANEKEDEEEFLNHSLSVSELDEEYDEDLDG